MAGNRKLNRPSDQRVAVMRGLVTNLFWYGHIETTEAKAKEVRKVAEKLITVAMKGNDGEVTVNKQATNEKGQPVTIEVKNDTPERLHARRELLKYLYEMPIPHKDKKENRKEYKARTASINHPVIEKLFREIAPKYAKRIEEKGQGGGYTRIIKKGPRRGDAAEMVILELV